jgi:TonB family protein
MVKASGAETMTRSRMAWGKGSRVALIGVVALLVLEGEQQPAWSAQQCPISVNDLIRAGQSPSGRMSVYEFSLRIAPGQSLPEHVTVVDDAGRESDVPFAPQPDAAFRSPRYDLAPQGPWHPGMSLGPSVEEAFAWFGRPIRSVRVVAAGRGATSRCDSTASVQDAGQPVTRIFPEPPADLSVRVGPADPSIAHPAQFVTKALPGYPVMEKENDISGTVLVGFTVEPNGTADSVGVVESSQDAGLDKAAVSAIHRSSFNPAMADGVPVRRSAVAEFDFVLDSTLQTPRIPACGLVVASAGVDGFDADAGNLLYHLVFLASSPHAANLSVALEDENEAPVATTTISAVHWYPPEDEARIMGGADAYYGVYGLPPADTMYTASVHVALPLPAARQIRLIAASPGGACHGSPILVWDRTDGLLAHAVLARPRSASRVPVVLPDVAFTERVWPSYPDEALAHHDEGIVRLVIDADASGHPTNVRIFKSSGSPWLDSAATQAAWLSTYPATGAPAGYVAEYQFVAHIPGQGTQR